MREGKMQVAIEALEGRQFLSATVPAVSSGTHAVAQSLVVKPAILGPSAVTGSYKGTAVFSGSGRVVPLKLKLSTNSATLVVTGYGTLTVAVSAKQFKKLRAGTFSFHGSASGETLSLSGKITKAGKQIAGNFSASGGVNGTGTFTLKKY